MLIKRQLLPVRLWRNKQTWHDEHIIIKSKNEPFSSHPRSTVAENIPSELGSKPVCFIPNDALVCFILNDAN